MKKVLRVLGLVALASADIQSDSLALHNNERNAYGVPSVTWSADLAASAQAYAETMASTGTTSHSTNRVNVGENLAWGSGGSVSVTSLGNLWIKEKQYFIPGTDFPGCSTTGSWHDVAHYTQLMWEQTTQIGCGLAQGNGRYNLVCHYSPQGNMNGEPVYTVGSSSSSPSTSSSSPSSSTGSASTQPSTGATTSSHQSNNNNNNNQNNYPQNNHHRGYPQNNNNNNNWNNNNNGNNEDNLDNNSNNNNNNDNTGATSQPATTSQPTTTTSQPSASSSSSSPASTSAPAAASSSQFVTDSLNAHNTERNNYGVPSLVWNPSLASTAQAYAQVMASSGTTSHSTNRVNVGENLAWGSGSSITTTSLIGLWLAEKQFYVPGTDFPYVSTTARWSDVAHYTQMMWEQTTDVGCGIAQASSGRYNLVCHYYVQGNIDGEPVYTVGLPPISSSSSSAPSSSSVSLSSPSSSSTTGSTSTQPTTDTMTTTPQTNTPSTTTGISTYQPSSSSSTASTSAPDASSSQFVTDCLTAHNTERNNYGVPSLVWNTSIAQTAQAYAQVMASSGTTSHSTGRVNVGENLAWGSGKSITTTHLIGLWIAEKQYFIPGTDFPDCSTTGSWHDLAHYTAMMWRKTTDVGCGIAQAGSGRYNLVCHYYVQGNIDGNPVY